MPEQRLLEGRLLRELANLNAQINSLELQKRTLERLINRVRREDLASREVTRIDSTARILVERAVLEKLESARGRSLPVYELRRAAETVEFRLNESTFRSHLHRLKLRGLIESAGHGRWKLRRAAEP